MNIDYDNGRKIALAISNGNFPRDSYQVKIMGDQQLESVRYGVLSQFPDSTGVAMVTTDDIEFTKFADGFVSVGLHKPEQYFCGDAVSRYGDRYYISRDPRIPIATFMIGRPDYPPKGYYKYSDSTLIEIPTDIQPIYPYGK